MCASRTIRSQRGWNKEDLVNGIWWPFITQIIERGAFKDVYEFYYNS